MAHSFRILVLAIVGILLAGCQTTTADGQTAGQSVQPTAAVQPAVQVAMTPDEKFAAWRAGLKAEALGRGVSATTFDRAFAGVRPNAKVLELDSKQAEFVRPIWEYLDSAVSDTRIASGKEALAAQWQTLRDLAATYGVPPEIVVAIWGLETNYGGYMGDFSVIEALATLAYQGRRTDSFREQLLIALDILQAGDITPERMRGSWAGAMGHTQFMPAAFTAYAVDHDRNGKRNMWDEPVDALASTANYLDKSGWRDGQPWGAEVVLPANFPWEEAELDTVRTVGTWHALGVRAAKDATLPDDSLPASVIAPAGHRGPAFLVLKNFRVIMRYNNATSYALAVAHLADRIGGGGPFLTAWPRNDAKLRIDDVREMQRLLTARGHNTGGVDGIVGPMTRAAIRGYQREIGAPPDGYPSSELLSRLKAG
ncbi:MAG: lytic murein transglycosylase [Rhodospirillaceae bacterium]|jgi:membrane-bound lytic murein transglycosylase B|nr:lytic murein transglycosylase [Rhodospirillaceae bacterium]MBT6117346.1 lytic murein transglycosylase [Rhodospirillaceae bacterium]